MATPEDHTSGCPRKSDALHHDTTYAYDEDGNATSVASTAGSISTTYDRLNRALDTTPDDTSTDTVYTYSFTAPSRCDASTGSTTCATFALDKLDRETTVTLPVSTTAFATNYRADGQTSERDDPDGNVTTFGYDAIGRLTTKNTTHTGTADPAELTYVYNRAGNRLSEASTVNMTGVGNGTASFGYDAMGRLASYGSPVGSTSDQAYTWQAVPNRSSVTTDPSGTPATTSYSYNAANRITDTGFSYDADGNLTVQPGQTLTWDSLGRLSAVKDSSNNPISSYSYDALDRLRTVARSSGTIRFRYVGTSTAVAEIVDDSTSSSIVRIGNSWAGERLADWTGSGSDPHYYGTNGHGDVTWVANGSGSPTASVRLDPWGSTAASAGTMPDWRFQGSWLDSSTGLYWVVARWYSPVVGTFVSEDSVSPSQSDPSSYQLTNFGVGDPANRTDGEGRWWHLLKQGQRINVMAAEYLGCGACGSVIINHNKDLFTKYQSDGSMVPTGTCVWIPVDWMWDKSLAPNPGRSSECKTNQDPSDFGLGGQRDNLHDAEVRWRGWGWANWLVNFNEDDLIRETDNESARINATGVHYRPRRPYLGEASWTNLRDRAAPFDAGARQFIADRGYSVHRYIGPVFLVDGDGPIWCLSNACTWGHYVFKAGKGEDDYARWSHEYIHVLQYENRGSDFWAEYLNDIIPAFVAGNMNKDEVAAYLWQGYVHVWTDIRPWDIWHVPTKRPVDVL